MYASKRDVAVRSAAILFSLRSGLSKAEVHVQSSAGAAVACCRRRRVYLVAVIAAAVARV
jgi:hypothetical protein